ncbi:MAG: hypothetical protein ACRC35_14530 [Angustibacter sp.]
MTIAAFVVSVVAALFAAAAAWSARQQARASDQSAAAAQDLAQIERERWQAELVDRRSAMLVVSLINDVPTKPRRVTPYWTNVMIRNDGRAPATDVQVTYLDALDGRELPDTSEWRWLGPDLRPGERRWASGWAPGRNVEMITKRFKVRIEWTDGNGHHHRIEVVDWTASL